MPSELHDLLVRLVLETPSLLVEILRGRLELAADAIPESVDATFSRTNAPTLRAADLALRFGVGEDADVIVFEMQLGIDPDKRWSWPLYVSYCGARQRCRAWLVVLALDERVARWARRPIPWLHGLEFVPIVIGPKDIPRITDPIRASLSPELALLGAIAAIRSDGLAAEPVVRSFIDATSTLDHERMRFYADLAWQQLNEHAPALLEKLMRPPPGYEYQSEPAKRFIAMGRQEGRTEGEVHVISRLLEKRFGPLSPATRERLLAGSLDDLDRWAVRILDAAVLDDVFES